MPWWPEGTLWGPDHLACRAQSCSDRKPVRVVAGGAASMSTLCSWPPTAFLLGTEHHGSKCL